MHSIPERRAFQERVIFAVGRGIGISNKPVMDTDKPEPIYKMESQQINGCVMEKLNRPTFRQTSLFLVLFQFITIPIGFWGWHSGLTFWKIIPGSILSGLVGGCFLSVGVHAVKTGYMPMGANPYRFSEHPLRFIKDSVMALASIIFSIAWVIGFILQELEKR